MLGRVAIRGDDDLPGAHGAVGRCERMHAIAFAPADYRARSMHLGSGRARRCQHSVSKLERMYRQRVGKTQRSVRLVAADVLGAKPGGGQKFGGILELTLQELGFLRQRRRAGGPVRDLEVARFREIALDGAIPDKRAYRVDGGEALSKPAARGFASPFRECLRRAVAPDRGAREAPVPAAASPARAIGLEHQRSYAAVTRQEVRAGESRVAAADDGDLGFRLRLRGAVIGGLGTGGGGPIGWKMFESGAGCGGPQRVVGSAHKRVNPLILTVLRPGRRMGHATCASNSGPIIHGPPAAFLCRAIPVIGN